MYSTYCYLLWKYLPYIVLSLVPLYSSCISGKFRIRAQTTYYLTHNSCSFVSLMFSLRYMSIKLVTHAHFLRSPNAYDLCADTTSFSVHHLSEALVLQPKRNTLLPLSTRYHDMFRMLKLNLQLRRFVCSRLEKRL